jgi:dolichyl-phosphate-mannose--protein O-mannosyl transferase
MQVLYRKSRVADAGGNANPAEAGGFGALSVDAVPPGGSAKEVPLKANALRRPFVIAISFGLATLALLLAGLGTPKVMFFDEAYFVPEARAFIQGIPNPDPQAPPLAKPPLGKLIMAIGMKAAGDNPFGWRIAGAVCGALTVVAVYLWVYLLLQNASLAFLAAWLTLFNNFLFVMSRIATVDVFLMFFLMWSLAAFTAALVLDTSAGKRRLLLCSAGVLVGLAGACKWNAIDTLAVFVFVTFAVLCVSRSKFAPGNPSLSGYTRNVEQIGIPFLFLALIVAPIAAYSLVFWPLCLLIHRPFNFHELAQMNAFMWHFNRTTPINRFIISPWYSWPLNLKPQRALSYLVGNPVITWAGLLALALCLRRFWKAISLPEGLVLLLFAANFLQWTVTPQSGLYYYYYYPCVMILGVAIAVALRSLPTRVFGTRISLLFLICAAVFFIRCYPQMTHLESPWDCLFGCWP